MILIFFILIAAIVSYIDIKKSLILDKIMFPSMAILVLLKYLDGSLSFYDGLAVVIVLAIFMVPIVLDMAFGGGDLRFGAFCALFLGLKSIGLFIMFAGLIHIIILGLLRKKSFGFAPAMSLSALLAYIIGNL
jgi:prepilin signal peptidase PulO-like enzyme (type II secretory pathway)